LAETKKSEQHKARKIVLKILKATIKAAIVYVVYIFLSQFLVPISTFMPGIQQVAETFVIIYIALMIIGELTSGTIFQHFFGAAKALFVIGYLLLSLNGGIFGFYLEGINLTVDLRLFLMIATLLGLLGLAKSVLQAINYMSEKAEPTLFVI
jgi:hypothetical protein